MQAKKNEVNILMCVFYRAEKIVHICKVQKYIVE
jgi:hypothetical protein